MKDEILTSSLVHLAQGIRNGTWTSHEVITTFINRIRTVNPGLNAVVVERFDEALEQARLADEKVNSGAILGRLHGVPITIKECLDWVGTPSTFGLIRRKDDYPEQNDPYVQVLLNEGAIILGKTNVSQLLAFIESDNPLYGKTNNPIRPEFTCGGSSGGEGAIIKAGGSLVGLGTDLGGSVRIPAAFCGISALKSTMHRNYDFSRIIDDVKWKMICSVTGVLGQYVEDIALMSEIIGSIPNPFNEKIQSFPDYKDVDLSEISIGYYDYDGLFDTTSEIKRGVRETIQKLKGMGISCKPVKPFGHEEAEALHTAINSMDGAKLFLGNLQKDKPAKQLRLLVMLMRMPSSLVLMIARILGWLGQESAARLGKSFGNPKWTEAQLQQQYRAFLNSYQAWMKDQDINMLITPVNSMHAYLHGQSANLGSGGTYTLIHNVTGYPAGVVPVSTARKDQIIPRKRTLEIANNMARKTELKSAGLPVSVQVVAAPWREDRVLRIMSCIRE